MSNFEDELEKEIAKIESEANKQSSPEAVFNEAVAVLSNHFDTVQIIATKHDKKTDLTDFLHHGFGNFFARIKSVEVFLTKFDNGYEEDLKPEETEEDYDD